MTESPVLARLLHEGFRLAMAGSPGTEEIQSLITAAYREGRDDAGAELTRVLTDLIDAGQLASPGVLAALVPLLPVPQQGTALRAAADLRQLAGADHDAFEEELEARMARFWDRARSGSPEGLAEFTWFLGNMFADPLAAGTEPPDWVAAILREQASPPDEDEAVVQARMERFHAGLERLRTDPEYAAHTAAIAAGADADLAAAEPRSCPDEGVCHHGCSRGCFRVAAAGPLTGVYPGDDWPHAVWKQHHDTDGVL
jgi:hypothetical protein